MKKCSQCQLMKLCSDFYIDKRDNTPRSYCKECSHKQCKKYRESSLGKIHKKKIRDQHYIQQQAFCNELKFITKCQFCEETCIACLDFHHIEAKDKGVNSQTTWTKLIGEIKKCIVLCANCHRKYHAGLIFPIFNSPSIPDSLIQKYIKKPHKVKTL